MIVSIVYYLLAIGTVITYTLSDREERIVYLFAAVILCINGATHRIIAALTKESQ